LADVQNSSRNRKLGAIAVAVVALAGVGTAYAASHLHTGSGTKNATPTGRGGFAGGRSFSLPPSNNDGNGNGGGSGFGGRGFRGGGFGGPGGSFSAATSYLGISQTQLFTDIRSGKTLAQVANATSGKSAAGLIAAMVAAQKSQLESAVQSGRITKAMANQIEANLKSRVTQMVNGGFGRFGGRGGNGFGGGNGGNGFGSPPSQAPGQGQGGQPGTSPT
jgi:hypothetical protein